MTSDKMWSQSRTRSSVGLFLLILGVIIIVMAVVAFMNNRGDDMISESVYGTTLTDDGIPFERYCGYLEEVGRGEIKFEGNTAESLTVVYMMFRDDKNPGQLMSKVIYGDERRLNEIQPGHYYDIGRRMYGEGMNFPRRLEIVNSCSE